MSRLTGPDAAIRRLAVARLISQGGTQAANIALIALVFERSNGSGVWIAAALLASLGARVVASPWAGTLGDYFDRRWVMVGSDLAAAGVFVVITETRSLTALVVLAALAGAAEAPFGPAANGLVAMLVPVERRGWANGTLSIGMSAGGLLGAALGGLLVAGVGASGAFLVNAVSFAVSAVLSASISGRFVSGARHEREHRGAWKGVQLLVGQRTLRLSAFSVALVALALGMVNVVQLPFFADIGAGKVGWGIALAAFGAGEICAGRLASRLVDARLERLALIAGCAVASVALAVTGATSAFVLAAVLFAATGFSNTLIVLGLVLSVQRWAPQELQGRTMAAVEAIVQSAIGVSLVVGGLLLSPLGAHGVYLLAGGLGCIGVVFALRIPRQPDPIRPDE
ncbi:MAG TPA: MFS transporter, partial [Sphingomicrobium sp.]